MEKQWKQCQTLFFWAPKSLQMVSAAMTLKDPGVHPPGVHPPRGPPSWGPSSLESTIPGVHPSGACPPWPWSSYLHKVLDGFVPVCSPERFRPSPTNRIVYFFIPVDLFSAHPVLSAEDPGPGPQPLTRSVPPLVRETEKPSRTVCGGEGLIECQDHS